MNILYSGDKNTRQGILLSVLSICEQVSEPVNVYVLTAGVSLDGVETVAIEKNFGHYIDDLVKKLRPENSATLIDVSSIFLEEFPTHNKKTRFTPSCMLRLFADLVDLPDRMLYLDYDVICLGDFSHFYHVNMTGIEFAGALDCFGRFFYNPRYVNSGVLLLNMVEIKRTSLFAKCRRLCQEKRMLLPDQSALNKLARAKLIVPRRYNEQKKSREDTVFRHFSTTFEFFPFFRKVTVKPWDKERMHSVLGIFDYDDLIDRGVGLYKSYKEKQ